MTELPRPIVDAVGAPRDPSDLTYHRLETALGAIIAARSPQGLIRLAYEDHNGGQEAVIEALSVNVSPHIHHAPAAFDDVARQIDEYLAGARTVFTLVIDWRLVAPFGRKVLTATLAIPRGTTKTYAEVAAASGSPSASRATGNALGANPIPIVIPCHRVLRTGGGLGGYTGGLHRKEHLLALEGVSLG